MTVRVDSHHHVWALARGDYDWITPQDYPSLRHDYHSSDLAPLLEKYAFDYSILIQAANTVAETDYLLAQARDTDFIKAVIGWVDMAADDAPQVLARLAEDGLFRGIRPMLMNIDEPNWILGQSQGRALDALRELGLVFDALVWPSQLAMLLKAMTLQPDLVFVVNHFGYPDIASGELDSWKKGMQGLAEETRACVKFSGVLMGLGDERPDDDFRQVTDHLLEHFGPRRIMWGSDWPHLLADSDYDAWYERSQRLLNGVDDIGLAAIYGGTAAGFYGLPKLRRISA